MNTKIFHVFHRWYSIMARNRFYEEARAVYKPMEQVYNIYLDKHRLVTPQKKPVELTSEALALAVAEEWNMQKTKLRMSLMRLTGLIFTAIDNPAMLTKSALISQVLEYLDKDTVLYRLDDDEKLLALEKKCWDPVIEWVNWEYGLTVKPSYSLVEVAVVDEVSRSRLANQLSAYGFMQLIGLQYATESLKSVFLTLATVSSRLLVDEAVELTLVEQQYQNKAWGTVEWAHDIEREELISRLSAGILIAHLGDTETEKSIKSQTESESISINVTAV